MDRLDSLRRSQNMAAIRSKHTSPERIVRQVVHSLGWRFRLHCNGLPGQPDIVLARLRSVVFVNGCFWHRHNCSDGRLPRTNSEYWIPKLARNRARDAENHRLLKQLGWRVLIVWECETRPKCRSSLTGKLRRFLSRATDLSPPVK